MLLAVLLLDVSPLRPPLAPKHPHRLRVVERSDYVAYQQPLMRDERGGPRTIVRP